MKEVNQEFDAKMQKTIEVVMGDFASVRAGRANAAVLDKITVDYYGTATPINHLEPISFCPRWLKTLLLNSRPIILFVF